MLLLRGDKLSMSGIQGTSMLSLKYLLHALLFTGIGMATVTTQAKAPAEALEVTFTRAFGAPADGSWDGLFSSKNVPPSGAIRPPHSGTSVPTRGKLPESTARRAPCFPFLFSGLILAGLFGAPKAGRDADVEILPPRRRELIPAVLLL